MSTVQDFPEYFLFQTLADSKDIREARAKIRLYNKKHPNQQILADLINRKAFEHMFEYFKKGIKDTAITDFSSYDDIIALKQYLDKNSAIPLKDTYQSKGNTSIEKINIGSGMIKYARGVANGFIKTTHKIEHEVPTRNPYSPLGRSPYSSKGTPFDPYKPTWRPGRS